MAEHEAAAARGHDAAMVREVVEVLEAIPPGVLLDATVGAGGHAAAVLESRPDLTCVGIDQDPTALESAARVLPRGASLHRRRFDDLAALLAERGIDRLAGVILDLGVSSMQLDTPERGFSYRYAGPIDMRMDPDAAGRAAEIVNGWPTERLAEVLRRFGDEPMARRVARAIVAARPLHNTVELAETISAAIGRRRRRRGGHPAKRSFQALRIAVNEELEQIRPVLTVAIEHLAPAGRGVVLSYHSGEDRIVKQTLRSAAGESCPCPPALPCACGAVAHIRLLERRPRRPTAEEVAANPRAASARLRSFEKLAAPELAT